MNQSTVNFIIDQGLLDALLVELRTHLCSLQVQISGLFLQVTTLPGDVRCDPENSRSFLDSCNSLSGIGLRLGKDLSRCLARPFFAKLSGRSNLSVSFCVPT